MYIELSAAYAHGVLSTEILRVLVCASNLVQAGGHALLQEMGVLKPKSHPASCQYLGEMKARPGYKKAVAH